MEEGTTKKEEWHCLVKNFRKEENEVRSEEAARKKI